MRTASILLLCLLVFGCPSVRADQANQVTVIGDFHCPDGETKVHVDIDTQSGREICVDAGFGILEDLRRRESNYGTSSLPNFTPLFESTRDTITQESTHKVCRSNPIDISSGKKTEIEEDFTADGEFPLRLERVHESGQFNYMSVFGVKWNANFTYSLHFESNYSAGLPDCYAVPGRPECTADTSRYPAFTVFNPYGRGVTYTKADDGFYWESKANPVAKALLAADGTWTVFEDDHTIKRYTKGGFLKEWRNEQGIGWTFNYGGKNGTQLQEIVHTSGRKIQFFWTDDALTQVKDPAGNPYNYTYIVGQPDTFGAQLTLKSVTYPGTPSTTVSYYYPNESTTTDPKQFFGLIGKSINNVNYSTFGYTDWKATSSEHAGGVERSTFTYTTTETGRNVVEVNPLGKETTFRFSPAGDLVSVEGGASANCAASSKGVTYDSNGYPDAKTDFNGNVTDYDYAPNGQLQKTVEGLGSPIARTTLYAWDAPNNRIVSETVPGDHETSYEYGADQRPSKVSVKNLSAAVPVSQGSIRVTTFSYTQHPNGLIATLTVDGPLSADDITFSYNTFGDLIQVKNALGHTTTYGNYDAMGRPGYVIAPNGRTDYAYDARGRVTTISRTINGVAQVVTNTYDGFGRLAKVTMPDGHYRAFQYDPAGRMLSEWEPEAGGTFAQKLYTYNAMSLPTSIKVRRISVEPAQGTVP